MVRRRNQDIEAVNALGKIYQSMTDKGGLCEFFLESVTNFIEAPQGYLFLVGRENQLWLETSRGLETAPPEAVRKRIHAAFLAGRPAHEKHRLFLPLIVRNTAIGIACFVQAPGKRPFSKKDMVMASDLATHMAAALKNSLLFEQNLQMERLASIGKTMGMVMHEIKNILQLATFADEWLTKGVQRKDLDAIKRGREGIRKALREMNGFIYEILSLTRDYKIEPKKVSLEKLIHELETDLADRARDYGVRLETKTDKQIGVVEAEARSLYRACLNILKNAMEACDRQKGKVKIEAQNLDAAHYRIVIEDNGEGMTDEVKARIRQPFFTTKGQRGTGLGMMIVERTVQAHKGTLKIESELGKGARFILTLPKKH